MLCRDVDIESTLFSSCDHSLVDLESHRMPFVLLIVNAAPSLDLDD